MDHQQFIPLRQATGHISEYLLAQTRSYLQVLRPALAPQRVLGHHVEHVGTVNAPQADQVWSRVHEAYKAVASKPFSLPKELRSPLKPIDVNIELYPWEYLYTTADGPITVRCPAKWFVTYRSSYTLSQVRETLIGNQSANKERLKEFVVNALVMREMLSQMGGLSDLLSALRLELGEDTSPETGSLPMATLTASITSRLPEDEVVVQATQFTGVREFLELIDPESVTSLTDPVRQQLQSFIEPAKDVQL